MGAEAANGLKAVAAAGLLGALFAATGILSAASSRVPSVAFPSGASMDSGGAEGGASAPRTFFAVRRVGAAIVEVELSSGRVVRTIVDLGGDPEGVANSGGLIDGIALTADGRALYFSRYLAEPGAVYRVRLPGGEPERVADGHGASVSPDGRWLAVIRGADVVIRDLTSQQERVFGGVVGDLGGVRQRGPVTAASSPSRLR